MLVQDVMQPNVVTVTPGTTLPEALMLTRQRRLRHLPVLDEGKLVGIVSDRDLKRASPSPATRLASGEITYWLARVTMAEIMTRAVVTIAPMFPVEEAARLMVTEKISALPVTEAGRLVGIITETDVLEVFVKALGTGEPSSRLDVTLGRGTLAEVMRVVEAAGAPVTSVMTVVARAGFKEAIIRVATINPGPAIKALESRGYAVRDSWRG
jgi:acetoin utilization protein AcuB